MLERRERSDRTHALLELRSRRVVVVGLGRSGIAAARLCARRGAETVGVDQKRYEELAPEARGLEQEGVKLALGATDAANLLDADLVVVSPGVPSFPALEAAERSGVPVIGELELACRALRHPAPVVAVGGTNGKSTTTTLVGALVSAAGLRAFVGGNLGEPLSNHAEEAFDAVVLEVSSFQMERARDFHPHVALLLNVTEDHLDRYASFDDYAHAKGNAFACQEEEDLAVVPHGDEVCLREARRGRASVVTFGPGGDVDVQPGAVVDRMTGHAYLREHVGLRGGHNALNVAAAIAAVAPFSVDADVIRRTLRDFGGLDHRMALVTERAGVSFYDDSKGTNVGASVVALEGLSEPKAVLIAGGRDKGGSYAPLARALGAKGRAAVLLGEAAGRIGEALEGVVPVVVAATMEEAVNKATELAQEGDAVLLSPACSSFDMFRDYKHRGEAFVRAVKALGGKP